MLQARAKVGNGKAKSPPGAEINILGAITFTAAPGGYQVEIDVASGKLAIPAAALDSYAACRRELLKRHAVRLVLWEVEDCRIAREARAAWLEAVDIAVQRGRATEVASYLKSGELDGVYQVRFWRGTFWLWRKGWYGELPLSEVRSHLAGHLNQHFAKLTTGITANCLMQLQAQTLLGSHVEAPAWLPGSDAPFPASETLVCRNMMVHLPGYLDGAERLCRPLTPRLFSTCGLDFDFERDAPAPVEWQKFLQTLWPDDPDSIDTLREWFGYSLLPDTSQHKILMLIGPKRSGKETVARVLRRLVGERNSAAPTLASLGTNFGLQPLLGKTLAVIGDARLGGRADLPQITERLLSISGEDDSGD